MVNVSLWLLKYASGQATDIQTDLSLIHVQYKLSCSECTVCLLHSFVVVFHYLVVLYYLSLLPFTVNKDEYICLKLSGQKICIIKRVVTSGDKR